MTAKVLDFDPNKKQKSKGGGPPDDDDEGRPRGAEGWLERIVREMKLVRDPSGRLFAVSGEQFIPTDSRRFKSRLAARYHEETGKDCGERPINHVLLRIEDRAKALPGIVPLRFAFDATGAIWVDCLDGGVRISADRVELTSQCSLAFYRPDGMGALPKPVLPKDEKEAGRALDRLWALLQLQPRQAHVAFAWLVAAILPERTLAGQINRFPVLCVVGSQGGGKTSKMDMLRQLVDPRFPLHTDFPPTLRDFAITAENQRVCAYDNISKITPLISDGLCRRATGDGIEIRALYSDREVITLTGANPAMINTITDSVFSMPDLQSRALLLNIGMMKRGRKTDEKVAAEFMALWPAALGALYYAVSRALRDIARTPPPAALRMSSACAWGMAAAPAVGFTRGQILHAYRRTQRTTDEITLDQAVPRALLAWRKVRQDKPWRGSASQLLSALKNVHTHGDEHGDGVPFPRTPEALRAALMRLEPVLKRVHITFSWQSKGSRRDGRNFAIWFTKEGAQ